MNQALEQRLKDDDVHVRAEAIRRLGETMSEKSIPQIVAELLDEKHSIVRLEISKV